MITGPQNIMFIRTHIEQSIFLMATHFNQLILLTQWDKLIINIMLAINMHRSPHLLNFLPLFRSHIVRQVPTESGMVTLNLCQNFSCVLLVSSNVIRLVVLPVLSNSPNFLKHLHQQHPPLHLFIIGEHLLLLTGLIDVLWLSGVGNRRGELLHILLHQLSFFQIQVHPNLFFPLQITFGLKLANLSSISTNFHDSVVLSRNLLHILTKGDNFTGFAGVLLQIICLVLPKTLIESPKLETNIVIDLVLGWDLHDRSDGTFHNPLQRCVLVKVFVFAHLILLQYNNQSTQIWIYATKMFIIPFLQVSCMLPK